MYILDIGHSIVESLRTFVFSIFEALLNAIIIIYDLFIKVAEQRLFDTEIIQDLYGRIGLILGLFMIFRLTFSAIEYLIDPDTMLDKQKGMGNIVKKVLIVVVLLGSIHFVFNKAYQLQTILLSGENNLIAKIFFNKSGDEVTEDNESLGIQLSWTIFSSFFTINEEVCNKSDLCGGLRIILDPEDPNVTAEIYNDLKAGLGFKLAYKYINEDLNEDYNWTINFEWFFGIVTAVLILWTLLIYLLQIGVRCIQLAYLEIIAPIPIMMYLNPKGDEKLKKWGSQCLTTYLDVFIRIAILYFILLAVTMISKIELGSASDSGLSIKIILIIALFMFAKKVPDLIKEIFPSMGGAGGFSFGIGMPKEVKGLATFGLGAGIGAVAGAATGIKYGAGNKGGRVGGALTGLVRGGLGGAKTKGNIFKNVSGGMANQRSAMQRAYDRNNDGSTFWGRTIGAGDAARTKAAFDEELSFYDSYSKNADIVDSELSKNANVKAVLAEQQSLMSRAERGGPLPTASEIAAMDKKVKAIRQTALQQEMNKRGTDQENKTLMSAIQNAEAMRTKAVQKGYAGFEKYSNTKIDDYADSFLDSVKDVKAEIGNIKDVSGSRNKAYKEAEANAKYAKNK